MNKFKRVVTGFMQRNSTASRLPKITNENATLRLMDLYILKHLEEPMTDEVLHQTYNRVKDRQKASLNTISRRRYDLKMRGLVENSNIVEKSATGKNRILWKTKTQS